MGSNRGIIDIRKPFKEAWQGKESDMQIKVISDVLLFAFEVPDILKLFAVPNGGKRHMAVAKKMKAEGVTSGVPDLCLPVPRNGFHGCWIELKTSTGAIKVQQWDRMEDLHADGYFVRVINCPTVAVSVLRNYLLGNFTPYDEEV